MEQQKSNSLRDFVAIIFMHKYKIVAVFAAVVVTVAAASFLMAPTYEAGSTVLVKFGREYIYRPEVGEKYSDHRSLIPLNQEEVINSEIQILTSKDLAERVVRTITVEHLYPKLAEDPPRPFTPLEAATRRFQKNLSAEGVKKSNVIRISFQHQDPEMTAKAVNLLVEFLKEKHLQVYSDPKSSFMEQQLTNYDRRLKQSQGKLQAFKQRHRVFALEEQRTLLLRQRDGFETALKNSENQIQELQKKLASLKEQMQNVPEETHLQTETERYKIIDDAKANLLALQLKEQELSDKYHDHNRLVVHVQNEIELVKSFIKKQEEGLKGKVRTGKNVVHQDLEKERIEIQAYLSSQEAKAQTIERQIRKLDREIQSLDLRENELEDIKRELTANEANYKNYIEKVEEARISEDLNRRKMANISVIQSAAVPAKPVKPRKLLNIILGILLGAVSGLGFAFFSEYARQGLSTPGSAEKHLGLPVLAAISYENNKGKIKGIVT